MWRRIFKRKNGPKHEDLFSVEKLIKTSKKLTKLWKWQWAITLIAYLVLMGVAVKTKSFSISQIWTGGTSNMNILLCGMLAISILVSVNTLNVIWTWRVFKLSSGALKKTKKIEILKTELKKTKYLLIGIIISSFSSYSLFNAFKSHNPEHLVICPVIAFVIFSNISAMMFKSWFKKTFNNLKSMDLYNLITPEQTKNPQPQEK